MSCYLINFLGVSTQHLQQKVIIFQTTTPPSTLYKNRAADRDSISSVKGKYFCHSLLNQGGEMNTMCH